MQDQSGGVSCPPQGTKGPSGDVLYRTWIPFLHSAEPRVVIRKNPPLQARHSGAQ